MIIAVLVLLMVAVICAIILIPRRVAQQLQQHVPDMTRHVIGIAKSELEVERQHGLHDLSKERQAVAHAVGNLNQELQRYETLIQRFEAERNTKYGELASELHRAIQGTNDLTRTTTDLVAVLGNSRVRGQWGQRMAEDILRFCGLQERLHYSKEQGLASGAGRPDYTFFLPDNHCLFMDVKFPLENYIKFVEATGPDQTMYRDNFLRDVRTHLRDMERRNYAGQTERSMDYILIFIPNEQVYGLMNEWEPGLIDECLQKKIMLCGPWTLYAVLRIIGEAWQHYRYSQGIQEMVKAFRVFRDDYETFKKRFEDLGTQLQKTQEKYHEIVRISFQRMDQKIQRILDHAPDDPSAPLLPTDPSLILESATTLKDSAHA